MQRFYLRNINLNKGFSLLEILIVIAIMGSVGLMIFTSGGDSKARKIQSDFDNVASYLSLYKNKAIGNSEPYFLEMNTVSVNGNISTTITPYRYINNVFGNQTNCEVWASEIYDQITNEKVFTSDVSELKICEQGVGMCSTNGTAGGICFFTDGSSRLTNFGSALLVQGIYNTDQGAAYRIDLHSATSFFEKLRCKAENILVAPNEAYCDFANADAWKTYE